MATSLHLSPLYGPVHSRRLGISLGINLLPNDGKCCTFDCIYCECGFNHDRIPCQPKPTREEVAVALETMLQRMTEEKQLPDVLTFAGNGEPTLHPDFGGIVDDVIRLRDRYSPQTRISVLSNATQLHRSEVREALLRVDNNIQKLDTACEEYIRLVDRPSGTHYSVPDTVRWLQWFGGHVTIQTMFMHGTYEGKDVGNTADRYVTPWIETLKIIRPEAVMVYTVDRDTPAPHLYKATPEELDAIRQRVVEAGFECRVSY